MPSGSSGPDRVRWNHTTARISDADVLELPASLLPTLPLPATLSCLQTFLPLAVHITTARAVYEALKRSARVVFGQLEWLALVSAFENERANPHDFAGWCDDKRRQPTWKLSYRDAIGATLGDFVPPSCARGALLGRVLSGFGLHLQRVCYGAEVPR